MRRKAWRRLWKSVRPFGKIVRSIINHRTPISITPASLIARHATPTTSQPITFQGSAVNATLPVHGKAQRSITLSRSIMAMRTVYARSVIREAIPAHGPARPATVKPQ
jgi:hypothetical protein